MAVEKKPHPSDVVVGRNLAQLRGDVSQAVLAERMRERGWKWSQATVWSIEQGARPLRLSEAQDVFVALGLSGRYLYDLTQDELPAMRAKIDQVADERERLVDSICDYMESRDEIASWIVGVDRDLLEALGPITLLLVEEVLDDLDDLRILSRDVERRRRERLSESRDFLQDERILKVGDERLAVVGGELHEARRLVLELMRAHYQNGGASLNGIDQEAP